MCQGDHADRSKCPSWSDWALSARLASGQCRSRAAVADLTSGHALSYSTLRDRTGRRWHPGPAPVAIDRSGPRSRISTSAVTVKVAKRSASGPDTAGASGPGLAPPPGAARSILQVRRAAYRPRTATAAAAADHQGSLSGRERRLGSGPTRQVLSLRPSLIRTPALADRHAMAARSEPACSAIASPMGSLTERPGWSTYLPSRWAGPDQAGTALPAACPNHVQIDSYTCIPPVGPLPGSGPAGGGVGRSWSDLVDDRWQDLLGRLEAAANEIEEIELPMERRPTP